MSTTYRTIIAAGLRTNKPFMNKSKSAFSAVEVLIVVAIIGLIAAITIPNLMHAREQQAKQKQAEINLTLGYPATAEQLQEGDVYEVTAAWRDPAGLEKEHLMLIRAKDNKVRLFSLNQTLQPGFYRVSPTGLLFPLQAATLEKN